MVKPGIGTAVLVIHRFPVVHGQDSCDGPVPLERDPNTDILSHAGDEIVKPFKRLRWKILTQSHQHDEVIKGPHEGFVPSLLIPQTLAFRVANSSPDAILMESLV